MSKLGPVPVPPVPPFSPVPDFLRFLISLALIFLGSGVFFVLVRFDYPLKTPIPISSTVRKAQIVHERRQSGVRPQPPTEVANARIESQDK